MTTEYKQHQRKRLRGLRFGKGIAASLIAGGLIFGIASSGGFAGATYDVDYSQQKTYTGQDIVSSQTFARNSAGYAQKLDGTWVAFTTNQMRMTDKGILIEEARSNGIRNNSMQGAIPGVLGSGGALPNNWAIFAASGLTTTIVGVGTELGIDYIDLDFSGTSNNVFYVLAFDSPGPVAAAGEIWTGTMFASARAGNSMTNVVNINTSNRQTGGTGTTDVPFNVLTSVLTRQPAATRTMATGATNAPLALYINMANGAAINLKLRIGWPQQELGAFATSPIRTTNAVVARAADDLAINNAGNYCSASLATIRAEFELSHATYASSARNVASIIIDGNNRHTMYVGSDSRLNCNTRTATVLQNGTHFMPNVLVINTSYKVAYRWAANDLAVRASSSLGTAPANVTSASVPAGAISFQVGRFNSGQYLNGYIKRLTIFPNAQNDNQMNLLVA